MAPGLPVSWRTSCLETVDSCLKYFPSLVLLFGFTPSVTVSFTESPALSASIYLIVRFFSLSVSGSFLLLLVGVQC